MRSSFRLSLPAQSCYLGMESEEHHQDTVRHTQDMGMLSESQPPAFAQVMI